MEPDSAAPTADERRSRGTSTFMNALIGAVAGVILSFIPLSTVLGGVLAGYLERGSNEDGAKVGAIAGILMFVPFLLVGYVVGAVLAFGGVPGIVGGFVVFALALVAIYTIGAAILGGVIGAYLRRELQNDRRRKRWE